jgi:hypothetical protein
MLAMQGRNVSLRRWYRLAPLVFAWASLWGVADADELNDEPVRETAREAYDRVPILPAERAADKRAPTDDEVWRALGDIGGDGGGVALRERLPGDAFRIKKELIADFIDPPRVLPLVGPAQVHFLRWKCCVCVDVGAEQVPNPAGQDAKFVKEVIYIDRTRLIALPDHDDDDSTADAGTSDGRNSAEDRVGSTTERRDDRQRRQFRRRLLRLRFCWLASPRSEERGGGGTVSWRPGGRGGWHGRETVP